MQLAGHRCTTGHLHLLYLGKGTSRDTSKEVLILLLLLVFVCGNVAVLAAYCEYYCETGLMDWGFMLPERIQPIQEEFMPKKMNKKYEAALHKAQEEQETTDSVLEVSLQ